MGAGGRDLTSEEKIRRCTDMQRDMRRGCTEVSLVKYEINNMRQAGASSSLTDVTPARQQETPAYNRFQQIIFYLKIPVSSAQSQDYIDIGIGILSSTSFLLYIFISHLALA